MVHASLIDAGVSVKRDLPMWLKRPISIRLPLSIFKWYTAAYAGSHYS